VGVFWVGWVGEKQVLTAMTREVCKKSNKKLPQSLEGDFCTKKGECSGNGALFSPCIVFWG